MQAGEEVLIPARLDIGMDTRLRRSLRRGSTTEVLNRVLDTSVIKSNNIWRKREGGRGGGKWLSMVMTYTQVENALGGALEILVDYVIVFHVTRHGENSWTDRIMERD